MSTLRRASHTVAPEPVIACWFSLAGSALFAWALGEWHPGRSVIWSVLLVTGLMLSIVAVRALRAIEREIGPWVSCDHNQVLQLALAGLMLGLAEKLVAVIALIFVSGSVSFVPALLGGMGVFLATCAAITLLHVTSLSRGRFEAGVPV